MLTWSKRKRWPYALYLVFVGLIGGTAYLHARAPVQEPAPVAQESQDQKEVKQASKINLGLPKRVKIPKIDVDSPVNPVGLLANGNMQAPEDPVSVGWFKDSPRPGDTGNSVIAGHYGRWENGDGSVFDNLNKLAKGDEIQVTDARGTVTVFLVNYLRVYNYNENSQDVFTSKDGNAHLNIITCQGTWDESARTYTQRLVVFADKK